jgi:hypothetical protein
VMANWRDIEALVDFDWSVHLHCEPYGEVPRHSA